VWKPLASNPPTAKVVVGFVQPYCPPSVGLFLVARGDISPMPTLTAGAASTGAAPSTPQTFGPACEISRGFSKNMKTCRGRRNRNLESLGRNALKTMELGEYKMHIFSALMLISREAKKNQTEVEKPLAMYITKLKSIVKV
jgi:hypothetical protein